MSTRFAIVRAAIALLLVWPNGSQAASFVWKVTGRDNRILYLGGSWHALRKSDYPLPGSFTRALNASNKVSFEVDPREMRAADESLSKAATYPKGDNLRNHVDPRTYNYIRRFFGFLNIPEEKLVRYRPWFIALTLQSPSQSGMSTSLGVEQFLSERAHSQSKPIVGLESAREHADVFARLSDRESEALLLLTFIPSDTEASSRSDLMGAWRSGNANVVWHAVHDGFRDFPSLGVRILDARNRNWIPKIEGYLGSGQTYFVVVGAAHMGGPSGVLALLRERGYKIEQL